MPTPTEAAGMNRGPDMKKLPAGEEAGGGVAGEMRCQPLTMDRAETAAPSRRRHRNLSCRFRFPDRCWQRTLGAARPAHTMEPSRRAGLKHQDQRKAAASGHDRPRNDCPHGSEGSARSHKESSQGVVLRAKRWCRAGNGAPSRAGLCRSRIRSQSRSARASGFPAGCRDRRRA